MTTFVDFSSRVAHGGHQITCDRLTSCRPQEDQASVSMQSCCLINKGIPKDKILTTIWKYCFYIEMGHKLSTPWHPCGHHVGNIATARRKTTGNRDILDSGDSISSAALSNLVNDYEAKRLICSYSQISLHVEYWFEYHYSVIR